MALVEPGAEVAAGVSGGDGAWTIVTSGDGATETLRATSCITNLGTQTLTVDMRAPRDPLEPRIAWDSEASTYNVEAASHHLGASLKPGSLEDRGVLELNPKSEWQDFELGQGDMHVWFFSSSLLGTMISRCSREGGVDYGVVFSNFPGSAHGAYRSVFQHVLQSTESLALAFQAVLARIHQMAFYEALLLPANAKATTSFSASALIPSRWTGFIATVALAAAHLAVVGIVTLLFLSSTSYSLIGNHWQAVSQVISEETRPILEKADGMRDKDVKR